MTTDSTITATDASSDLASRLSSRMAKAVSQWLAARHALDHGDETLEDIHSDAFSQADDRVTTTLAQSIADLRVKIDILLSDSASNARADQIDALIADVRRLDGERVSPVFDPASFIAWFERSGGAAYAIDGKAYLGCRPSQPLREHFRLLDRLGGREAVAAFILDRAENAA